ncbi:MAG: hypothetical protein R2717_05825 [Schumannella sp.]
MFGQKDAQQLFLVQRMVHRPQHRDLGGCRGDRPRSLTVSLFQPAIAS